MSVCVCVIGACPHKFTGVACLNMFKCRSSIIASAPKIQIGGALTPCVTMRHSSYAAAVFAVTAAASASAAQFVGSRQAGGHAGGRHVCSAVRTLAVDAHTHTKQQTSNTHASSFCSPNSHSQTRLELLCFNNHWLLPAHAAASYALWTTLLLVLLLLRARILLLMLMLLALCPTPAPLSATSPASIPPAYSAMLLVWCSFDLTWGPIEYHRRSLDNLQAAMRQSRKLCAIMLDTLGREVWVCRSDLMPWWCVVVAVHAYLSVRADVCACMYVCMYVCVCCASQAANVNDTKGTKVPLLHRFPPILSMDGQAQVMIRRPFRIEADGWPNQAGQEISVHMGQTLTLTTRGA
jgi:hypothetical protein